MKRKTILLILLILLITLATLYVIDVKAQTAPNPYFQTNPQTFNISLGYNPVGVKTGFWVSSQNITNGGGAGDVFVQVIWQGITDSKVSKVFHMDSGERVRVDAYFNGSFSGTIVSSRTDINTPAEILEIHDLQTSIPNPSPVGELRFRWTVRQALPNDTAQGTTNVTSLNDASVPEFPMGSVIGLSAIIVALTLYLGLVRIRYKKF